MHDAPPNMPVMCYQYDDIVDSIGKKIFSYSVHIRLPIHIPPAEKKEAAPGRSAPLHPL